MINKVGNTEFLSNILDIEHLKTDLGADKNPPNPNKKIPVRTSAILGIPALHVGNKNIVETITRKTHTKCGKYF